MQDYCEKLKKAGPFDDVRWITLGQPKTIDRYQKWLIEGRHGDMQYLERHLPLKNDPQLVLAGAKSLVVVSQSYYPPPELNNPFPGLRIAKYALSPDYHHWMNQRLENLVTLLKQDFPTENFLCAVDSKPILERDFAAQAGLGWIGKNTCLIHPDRGSFSFIGEILTTVQVQTTSTALPDFCGKCNKCIVSCPTQALSSEGLDARKCISYLNIESKSLPAKELRNPIGDLFFGCDICQDVCPWNIKSFKKRSLKIDQYSGSVPDLIHDLKFVLSAEDSVLLAKVKGTALERTKPKQLKRNALIIAGNLGLSELREDINKLLENDYLQDLATWALTEIKTLNS